MEKIIEDQEEFEKEHQFMQVRIAPFSDVVFKCDSICFFFFIFL